MIAHIVIFRFRQDASAALVPQFAAELDELRDRLGPLLISYEHGPALRLREPTGDYGIFAVVADEAALHHYLDEPSHHDVTRRYSEHLFESRTAVQIQLPSGRAPSQEWHTHA